LALAFVWKREREKDVINIPSGTVKLRVQPDRCLNENMGLAALLKTKLKSSCNTSINSKNYCEYLY
jgi:hypothetical protein